VVVKHSRIGPAEATNLCSFVIAAVLALEPRGD